MYDTIYKRLFADRRLVEQLIRRRLPAWAERLDFDTLRQGPAELIGEKQVKRLPDAVWSGQATNGDTDFLLLLEFQSASDPDMAMRTTICKTLAVQELRQRQRRAKQKRKIAIQAIVLYHGDGRWTAQTSMEELVEEPPIQEHQVVEAGLPEGAPTTLRDLPELLLGFGSVRSAQEVKSLFSKVARVVTEWGDPHREKVMAREIRNLLEYRGFPVELLMEANDMRSSTVAFRQSLDDLKNQGRLEAQRQNLVRLATLKFGQDAGEALSTLVGEAAEPDFDGWAVAILESESASAFLDRARQLPNQA